MPACPAHPDCSSETFDADPDIAGIGVITAFLVSAWSSLLITSIEYSSRHADVFNPYSGQTVPLDDLLRDYIKWITKPFKKPWDLQSIQPVVLATSDQQLVTGLAIMTTGYIQHCTITQYHFDIVACLGGIAFNVYQPALYALDGYTNRDPRIKLWRTILMTILFGMVIPSILILYDDDFLDTYGASTQCIWDHLISTHRSTTSDFVLSINLTVTIWAYVDSMRYLYPTILRRIPRISSFILRRFGKSLGWIERKTIQHAQRLDALRESYKDRRLATMYFKLCYRRTAYILVSVIARLAFWVAFIPVFTFVEIARSHFIDIWRAYTVTLAWTIEVISVKQDVSSSGIMKGSENIWGFGQILPLLLLILPVMSTWELFRETQHSVIHGGGEHFYTCQLSDLSGHSTCQQQVIESNRGISPNKTSYNTDIEDDISDRMYRYKLFRIWAAFCSLGIFGGSTYAAIIGYAI
ncbi:hypothetical protein F5Y11DRAFT_310696 [Daldinia sp. FL1419]|nr:hypothetical protein F5Y11DRAFT_310696 [Daldinia sp. FL1419]